MRARRLLLQLALRRALRKPLPQRFKLSDPGNDFVRFAFLIDPKEPVFIDFTSAEPLCVNQELPDQFLAKKFVVGSGVEGTIWLSDSQLVIELCKSLSDLAVLKVEVQRFFRGVNIKYTTALEFLLLDSIGWHRVQRLKAQISIWLYRRTIRFHRDRMDLLRALIGWRKAEALADGIFSVFSDDFFTSIDACSKLYSDNFFLLDDSEQLHIELKFLLDSLVSGGELELKNGRYRLLPRALVTLHRYDIEVQRHNDAVKAQRSLVLLTLVLAGVALLDLFL